MIKKVLPEDIPPKIIKLRLSDRIYHLLVKDIIHSHTANQKMGFPNFCK